jgi:REP element-mobilizing transposase RayT
MGDWGGTPLGEPLAYFLTWTCYGTWLPGDERGWVDKHDAGPNTPYKPPDPLRRACAAAHMDEPPVIFSLQKRMLVDTAIRETCTYRGWFIHRLSVRSNHVHVVVTAPHTTPESAMQALKANATQALNGLGRRKHWWTDGGSKRYLNDERSLRSAIEYVANQ